MKQLAERSLTPKQRALVDNMVSLGCSQQKAAELAGYAPGNSAKVAAWKALQQPHVQQYMQQRILDSLGTHAATALGTVAKLSKSAKSEYVQLEASKDLLDRAGYKPVDRSQIQVAGDIRVSIDLG